MSFVVRLASKVVGARRPVEVERRDASLVRRARGVAALAIPLLLATAQISDDPEPMVSPGIVAVMVGLVLLLVNVLDPARQPDASASTLRRAAAFQLAIDTSIVAGVVWLAGSDPKEPLWVLLVLPILEAALRFGANAALVALAGVSVAYVARDAWSAARFDVVSFSPSVVAQRVGILAVIGVTAGFLAAQLAREASRARDARTEAVRHSETLEVVADAARLMTSLDRADVLRNLSAAAHRLGFSRIGVATFNGVAWEAEPAATVPVSDHVMELIAERLGREASDAGRTISVGPDHVARVVHESDLGAAVVVPIRGDGEVVGSLAVAGVVSDELLGALELMSSHAGVVLTQAAAHSEIRRLQQRLQHQAFHDSLTGLPNRASLAARFRRGRDRRDDSNKGVAVLFVDLDGFKVINDTLGHSAGDELLAAVGRRVKEALRPTDTVARLGGDEFVALLERVSDVEGARVAAERVLDALEAPFRLSTAKVRITASIGVVFRDDLPEDADELIRDADEAMYEAKRHGKGRVVVLDDVHEELSAPADARRSLQSHGASSDRQAG